MTNEVLIVLVVGHCPFKPAIWLLSPIQDAKVVQLINGLFFCTQRRKRIKDMLWLCRSWYPAKAYVTQDDKLIATLTVRGMISYSSRLRLPDNMPMEEKRALIEGMIVEMGLQDCADTGSSAIVT